MACLVGVAAAVHVREVEAADRAKRVRVGEEGAHDRARRGVARPIFYKGEQVGEYRHYDERLTMFLLRSFRPERYGKALDLRIARREDELDGDQYRSRDPYERNDPGMALEGQLTGIEFLADDVPRAPCDDDEEPYAL